MYLVLCEMLYHHEKFKKNTVLKQSMILHKMIIVAQHVEYQMHIVGVNNENFYHILLTLSHLQGENVYQNFFNNIL